MKSWDYYSPPNLPYFGYEEREAYEKELLDKINNSKMTADERKEALSNVKKQINEHTREKNEPYYLRKNELEAEFWNDAREELGYTDFLNEDGVSALEYEAYERGHSSGYSEVYLYLDSLTEFAKKIIKGAKRDSTNKRSGN